jgi:hypothetical protein
MSIELVQIKFDGRLREIPVAELDMDPTRATDAEVRHAVARHLGIDSLDEHHVDPAEHNPDRATVTVLNLRPEAPFGCAE